MFWRGDTHTVYVFVDGGTGTTGNWYQFADTWVDGEPTPVTETPPTGLYVPVRGFGKIWLENPGLKQALGWATDTETSVTSAWEAFKGGSVIWTADQKIRVLYDNAGHTWEMYHDTYATPTPQVKKGSSD